MYQLSFYSTKKDGTVVYYYKRKEVDDLWNLLLTVQSDDMFDVDGFYIIEYNNSPVVKRALTRAEVYQFIKKSWALEIINEAMDE